MANKNVKETVETEANEVVEAVVETKKANVFTKAKNWTKKNAKKIGIGAAIGAIGLVTGYALGRTEDSEDWVTDESGDEHIDVTDQTVEANESTSEVV